MSVGKDEAVINSVYIARTPGGEAESRVLPTGSQFYVIVQAEVGSNVCDNAVPFILHAALQTIPSAPVPGSAAISVTNFINQTGNTFDGWTPDVDRRFFFGPVTAGPADTLYKPLAALVIGKHEQDVSVLEGNSTVVTE